MAPFISMEKMAFLRKLAEEAEAQAKEETPAKAEGESEGKDKEEGAPDKDKPKDKPELKQEEQPADAPAQPAAQVDGRAIMQFFFDNPNPDGAKMDQFVQGSGADPVAVLTFIGKLATVAVDALKRGASVDAGITYSDVPQDVFANAVQVEMKHGCEILAKKIALDNLAIGGMNFYDNQQAAEPPVPKEEVVATPEKKDEGNPVNGSETEPIDEDPNSEGTEKTSTLKKLASMLDSGFRFIDDAEAKRLGSAFMQKVAKVTVPEPGWKPAGPGSKTFERNGEIATERPTRTMSNRKYRNARNRAAFAENKFKAQQAEAL